MELNHTRVSDIRCISALFKRGKLVLRNIKTGELVKPPEGMIHLDYEGYLLKEEIVSGTKVEDRHV